MDLEGVAIETVRAVGKPRSPAFALLRQALGHLHRDPTIAEDQEFESLMRQFNQRAASTVGSWTGPPQVPDTDWQTLVEHARDAATALLAARSASSPWEGIGSRQAAEIARLGETLVAIAHDVDPSR